MANEIGQEFEDKRGVHRDIESDFNATVEEDFFTFHNQFKKLRSECPVAFSDSYDGFWALTKYEDVVESLKDYKTFTSTVQNTVPKFTFTGRRPPLHLDPPEHTLYRRVINLFFTREKVEAIRPLVLDNCIEVLEATIEQGTVDFGKEYGYKFPPYVFADFFNLDKELSLRIKDVSSRYVRAIQEMDHPVVRKLSFELYDIAQSIIDLRKEEPMDPNDDLTSALLAAKYDGEHLPDDLVLGTVRQLILTGMVAPSIFLNTMFTHLAMNQDIQDQLRNDLSLVPAAIEEYLRLITPYRGMSRTPTEDVVIGGRLIKKGEPVAMVYASANRDEEIFENSEEFILNRPNIDQHISFGKGPHKCPGEPIARLMLTYSLEEALKRTKKIEYLGDIRMTPWAEWGVHSVKLKFTR